MINIGRRVTFTDQPIPEQSGAVLGTNNFTAFGVGPLEARKVFLVPSSNTNTHMYLIEEPLDIHLRKYNQSTPFYFYLIEG